MAIQDIGQKDRRDKQVALYRQATEEALQGLKNLLLLWIYIYIILLLSTLGIWCSS